MPDARFSTCAEKREGRIARIQHTLQGILRHLFFNGEPLRQVQFVDVGLYIASHLYLMVHETVGFPESMLRWDESNKCADCTRL